MDDPGTRPGPLHPLMVAEVCDNVIVDGTGYHWSAKGHVIDDMDCFHSKVSQNFIIDWTHTNSFCHNKMTI